MKLNDYIDHHILLRSSGTFVSFFWRAYFCLYRNYNNNCQPKHLRPSAVLYDQACPMCRKEMHRLKGHDRFNRLRLVDIAAPDFNAGYWGLNREAVSEAIHVQTPEGQWLMGMPALRHVYAQVGLGWIMAPSGWPMISPLADRLYAWIAPNRQWLSIWMGLRDQPCSERVCKGSKT